MAEVLSPIVSHNDTISRLQNRSSTSNAFHSAMSGSQNHQSRPLHIPRDTFTTHTGYRGTATPPVSPYAFKSTPALRSDTRAVSAPIPPLAHPLTAGSSSSHNRQRYPAPESVSTISSISSSDPSNGNPQPYSKDDALLFTHFQPSPSNEEPQSVKDISVPNENPNKPLTDSQSKSSPERYHRGHRRAESSVGSVGSDSIAETAAITTAQMGQIYHNPQPVSLPSPTERSPMQTTGPEVPKRYRYRYSVGNMETGLSPSATTPTPLSQGPTAQTPLSHGQRPSSPSGSTQRPGSSSGTRTIPSADAVRRINNPSPLSRPVTASDPPKSPEHRASPSQSSQVSQSPAVAAMSALNEREASKGGVKSRLRRAFSFGSAQELRRSSEADLAADRAKARREQFHNEIDDEQEAIAQRQEATGLGNGIYTSHSNTFTGSTDNLSISSTASSASMMLRRMGNGMRKGGRSLKGLFRPKSVVGVPSADAVQASVGSVTLVNVEAERDQVNVNAEPHEHPGGGTGFPKLEQNSLDTGRGSISSRRESQPPEVRRSIIGGDAERAEVMSAVKRGILKPSNTGSPLPSPGPLPGDRPYDRFSPTFGSSHERHASPAGSTTSSEPRRSVGHRRTDSSTIEGDDYFANLAHKFSGAQSSKSLPGTPREYDRRGDIATCNRLTPLLAQQIKEELNTFKMEMEVHELSKPHTHFF